MLFSLLTYLLLLNNSDSYPKDYWTAEARIKYSNWHYNYTERDKWAGNVLRRGDIICRKGNAVKFGFNFSNYIGKITDSEYSHCGLVNWGGWIYDLDESGVRLIPFAEFMKESVDQKIVVLRPKDSVEDDIRIDALHYAMRAFNKGVKFDYNFDLRDDELYCCELVHRSYIEGRLLLSVPIKVGDLPSIANFPLSTIAVRSGLRLINGDYLPFDQRLYIIGNSKIGLMSSKYLKKVYEGKIP